MSRLLPIARRRTDELRAKTFAQDMQAPAINLNLDKRGRGAAGIGFDRLSQRQRETITLGKIVQYLVDRPISGNAGLHSVLQ